MYILFYLVKSYLRCLKRKKIWKEDDAYLGLSYYFGYKGEKKSMFRVLKECNTLAHLFHCYPDTYFIFNHFLPGVEMSLLKTFLPQDAYGRFSWGGCESTSYKLLVNDKIIFHDIMDCYGIKVPTLLFKFYNNMFWINNKVVADKDIDDLLSSIEDERIFAKLPSAGAASGVFVMHKKNGVFVDKGGAVVTAELIRISYQGKNIFFEKQIRQDARWNEFNPSSVNTIRVLTINMDNKKEIVMAAARFGRKNINVDNMHAGGIGVNIDIEQGTLGIYGGRRYDTTKYYEHPDSHIKFEGKVIPYWDEIKTLVYSALDVLPPYRTLGFDVAITSNGPIVLEINTGAGMDLAQVGMKFGIASVFEKYLS